MPVPSENADGPHDVRWRMVAGMETAFHYAIRLVSYRYASRTVGVQLLEYVVLATSSNYMEVPRALQ